jgi:flagellin-like hook-associated protein FlgL
MTYAPVLAQTADLDIWRHPITLLIIAAVLGAIGTAVGFALRQIMAAQHRQDTQLAGLSTSIAVRNATDDLKATQSEARIGRIESEVQSARAEIGAVHRRLDHALERLGVDHESRPWPPPPKEP